MIKKPIEVALPLEAINRMGWKTPAGSIPTGALKKWLKGRSGNTGGNSYSWEPTLTPLQPVQNSGVSANRAANYNADSEGTRLNYEAVSDAVSNLRACRPIDESWKAQIDEDYVRRNKKKR
jgi:hypothetical protein